MDSVVKGLALKPEEIEQKQSASMRKIHDLRLSQDFDTMAGVEEVVTSIAIGKPNGQTFFRVHPTWSGIYPIFEQKTESRSEFFIVDTNAVPEIADEVKPRMLVPVVTRDGCLYVWPLRLGVGDKELDPAGKDSLVAMQTARAAWVRMSWTGKKFKVTKATSLAVEPKWSALSFEEMLDLAFDGRVVSSSDHPVVKALTGEA